MAITSTNFNPKNDSKYARRKSIFKGSRNQLREWVKTLQSFGSVAVHGYLGPAADIIPKFTAAWGDGGAVFGAYRHIGTVTNSWVASNPVPKKMKACLSDERLKADLELIWDDVNGIFYRRFGNIQSSLSHGAVTPGAKEYFKSGEALIVWAFGPGCFDLIISKHGFNVPGYSSDPHYYVWQARTRKDIWGVPVDDFDKD